MIPRNVLLRLTFCSLFSIANLAAAADPPATQPSADANWPMAGKNYSNTRFSELADINAQNVKDLKLAWSFDTGVYRGQEAAPVVVGDTMYVVTPYPNILYAL